MHRLIAILLLLLAPAAASAADLSAALTTSMQGKAAPGAAVLVIKGYLPGQEAVRGFARMDTKAPLRPGQRWHLGSDTKAMTATLVGRLVDKGLLRWDAPLEKMLPELATVMRAEYRDVTLVELMSHRSGLPENPTDDALFKSFYDSSEPLQSQRLAWATAGLKEAPVGPKRAKNSYSNTGFVIAGLIAERAAGKPYETLMQEEVFAPLGIRSATFDQRPGPDEPWGHVDGRVADRKLDPNPPMLNPAGGARMTLRDWAMFCVDQMHGFNGRGRLLKPETYRMLQTAQGDNSAALGWGAQAGALGRKGPTLGHSGSDGNWMAIVVLFPKTGEGVLSVTNAAESMGGDKLAVEVARAAAVDLSEPRPPS
jgi:CubicO group peptidase (beta-lactamase class C family)